ncbi:MFS transporter [Streptomyces pseudovenezuelae]|uniref:MFS family arabinose efflux permease n=1 Tax=Streptomyces pseudovenezuelae TaxID=67350 RepID=A0ABT6LXP7_9ACTN|nr:MFS transporter [Streptomyces pseudovenezuelae]MDH6221078.1 putative MFS family arabinose efflux permease [Streptomyces pseudovenezuelae]
MTLLFALAGGAAVGNLYWAQPLLNTIAGSLHISSGSAGLLVTLTQIGYALGAFLVVPLGDRLNRRRLIPVIMFASALALAGSAAAPGFTVLLVALALVGVTTVAGQLLVPLAGDLAREDQRGRAVGTVASGILIGILVSRAISGIVADAFGWRTVYWGAAALMVALTAVLARVLPTLPPSASASYPALLKSVLTTVRRHRAVQVTLVLGAITMMVFTLFWTALTFLLSAAPFHYSATRIGLVSLVGLAGALAAQQAGHLHDRGWSVPATGAGLLLALASVVLGATGGTSIVVVLVVVWLLNTAIQSVNVLNQTRLMSVDPQSRSRLNTAFVTGNFIGGTIGSALASALWQSGGWTLVMTGAALLFAIALLVWAAARRTLSLA